MSKSLKNFVTIRAALTRYSARQLRLLFLLHHWAEPMELTALEGCAGAFMQCEQAVAADRTLSEFFHAVKSLLRAGSSAAELTWLCRERELAGALERAKVEVHCALCDNVDTPRVLRALLALVRSTNVYLHGEAVPRPLLVQSVARYVTRILAVFGAAGRGEAVGFEDGGAGGTREDALTPCLDALVEFRRASARATRACVHPLSHPFPAIGTRCAPWRLQRPPRASCWPPATRFATPCCPLWAYGWMTAPTVRRAGPCGNCATRRSCAQRQNGRRRRELRGRKG